MSQPKTELIPTTCFPTPFTHAVVKEAEAMSKARRETEAKAQPKREPTEAEIRNELAVLEREAEELYHYAKQSESSCKRAAQRVHHFESRLKLLRDSVPNVDLLLAKYKAGERVYTFARVLSAIEVTQQNYDDALRLFDGQRNIAVDWDKRLKNFHQHRLPRLEELQKKVREWDTLYSVQHGTDRTRGIGRW